MSASEAVVQSGARILVVAPLVDGWLIFYTKALSNAGYNVTLVTNLDTTVADQDHVNVLYNFSHAPFCRLIDIGDTAKFSGERFDFAISDIQGASSQAQKDQILSLIGQAPRWAIFFRRYDSRFPAMVRLLVKEALHPFIRCFDRVIVEEYQNASFLLKFLASPHMTGIVPHQRVTCRGMANGIGDRVERDYLFNFLGGYDGQVGAERTWVIDQLEARFHLTGGEQELDINGRKARVMWYADRPGNTRKRPMNEYFDRVGNAYFTICPGGDTITTHRHLEAIHCGSIPIMNGKTMPQYGLPFEHGKNCWLVNDKDWVSAVIAISKLEPEKVFAMQNEVRSLASGAASIPALERKCLRNLGLVEARN